MRPILKDNMTEAPARRGIEKLPSWWLTGTPHGVTESEITTMPSATEGCRPLRPVVDPSKRENNATHHIDGSMSARSGATAMLVDRKEREDESDREDRGDPSETALPDDPTTPDQVYAGVAKEEEGPEGKTTDEISSPDHFDASSGWPRTTDTKQQTKESVSEPVMSVFDTAARLRVAKKEERRAKKEAERLLKGYRDHGDSRLDKSGDIRAQKREQLDRKISAQNAHNLYRAYKPESEAR